MLWKRRTYLDYAAGGSANSSSPHEEGRKSREVLERARTDISRVLEVQSDDVIFTSGATEANALALLGHVRARGVKNSHVLYLPSAHASIVENVALLAREGADVEELPIENYRVDIKVLERMVRPETVLVTMDAVCGETGVIWNTREVAHLLKTFAGTAPVLHVDASQAPLTEKMTRAHFDADLLTLDASKVGGIRDPSHFQCGGRGIGALVAHRTIPIAPLYAGGGQERGLRPGSEAPELAEQFAVAIRAAARGRESFRASAEVERARLVERIKGAVSNVEVNESPSAARQAPHILNLSLTGRDTDYLVALLDEAGFAVSTRSACETDSEDGSRAVFALTGDAKRARATLRISWGPRTSPRDLARFARALANAVAFVDNEVQR